MVSATSLARLLGVLVPVQMFRVTLARVCVSCLAAVVNYLADVSVQKASRQFSSQSSVKEINQLPDRLVSSKINPTMRQWIRRILTKSRNTFETSI